MGRLQVYSYLGLTSVLLTGCAASTGILPAGPNTYTIEERFAPVRGGGQEAERVALTKADAFCRDQGRQFVPAMMGKNADTPNPYGPTGYAVTFKCLAANDPALAGYQIQQAPHVIVEQRNR